MIKGTRVSDVPAPPQSHIELDFREQFQVEEGGSKCENDYLLVRDGTLRSHHFVVQCESHGGGGGGGGENDRFLRLETDANRMDTRSGFFRHGAACITSV